jgi:hypothetical protein
MASLDILLQHRLDEVLGNRNHSVDQSSFKVFPPTSRRRKESDGSFIHLQLDSSLVCRRVEGGVSHRCDSEGFKIVATPYDETETGAMQ